MRARLMIVDPLWEAALMLEHLAHAQGWEVRTVTSAGEALRAASVFHPQAVLIAIDSPEELWVALARRLRVEFPEAAYLVGLSPSQSHAVHAAFPGVFDLVLYEPMRPSDLDPVREGVSQRNPELVFGRGVG